MIEPNQTLSKTRQCELLGLARSSYYYQPEPVAEGDLTLLRLMDEQYLKTPQYGARSYATWMNRQGYSVGRKKVTTLMRQLGIISTAPKPSTSRPHKAHTVYPYLLRNRTIDRPNQVWASDITYVPLENGFGYLTVMMDWYSRKVLSWRLSNTLEVAFCVEALAGALYEHGCPEIVNTDQGAQFTSNEFTGLLKAQAIQISMDDKGCYRDNIFVERLWRTVKYECLYTRAFNNLKEVKVALTEWFCWYNQERFHQRLDNLTPDEAYYADQLLKQAA